MGRDFVRPFFLASWALYLRNASENAYVRVTGTLKTFGNRRYINTTQIRPSKDPHELYFHILEAMTVNLIFERGMVSR